jgi:hypothetical protein
MHIGYLSMKQGRLFCFVCHTDSSQTTALHVAFLVSMESSWWVRVDQLGLRLFGAMGVEAIDYWTILKIKTKIENKKYNEIWGRSWCSRKVLGKSDLTEFISRVSESRCGRYYFWVNFVAGNSKTLQKLGL